MVLSITRENEGTEREALGPLGYVMPMKVIYRRAEVFVLACMKSVFREVRMQANLGLMFERKAKISCNSGQSVIKNLRARQDCRRTSRKTDFCQKNKTSAGLKITFVNITYPGQRPELPSLSCRFLLSISSLDLE